MIPSGARVLVAAKPVDFRKGPDSLMALVRESGADPFSGALYVFRSRRSDRVKIVWWDGSGLCLFAKRLDEHGFHWPRIEGGVIRFVERDRERIRIPTAPSRATRATCWLPGRTPKH